MQIYKHQQEYLTCYDISENQLILCYPYSTTMVPNIPHNIEICERKLMSQFLEFKKQQLKIEKINRNLEMIKLAFLDFPLFCWVQTLTSIYIALIVYAPLITYDIVEIVKHHKIIKHFELTQFCLENITKIKQLTSDTKNTLVLSKTAQEALNKDQGFTLNHSDQYNISDLKQLKKALSIQSGNKDIWKK